MSQDITFCAYSNCKNKECIRHTSNIADTTMPHSFAYFDSCTVHQKTVNELQSAISDLED